MHTKQRKSILGKYLGISPALFDLRKKEILNDKISIEQWQVNMNFLIYKHGTIDSCEKAGLEYWTETFGSTGIDKSEVELYLEEHVTPVLLNISDVDLPRILDRRQDRNWFLAAYPDVFEYFFSPPNLLAEDFDSQMPRVENHVKAVTAHYEGQKDYLPKGKRNQTIYLVRMKNVFKN